MLSRDVLYKRDDNRDQDGNPSGSEAFSVRNTADMRQRIAKEDGWRIIAACPTALIAARSGERRGVKAVAWLMPVCAKQGHIAAVIGESHTRELIYESGTFTVNVPPRRLLDLVYSIGTTSGYQEDKFDRFGINASEANEIDAPLIDGCIGWLECRLIREIFLQKEHDIHIAEIVAAWIENSVYQDGFFHFPSEDMRSVHHVSKGIFHLTGDPVAASQALRPVGH